MQYIPNILFAILLIVGVGYFVQNVRNIFICGHVQKPTERSFSYRKTEQEQQQEQHQLQ